MRDILVTLIVVGSLPYIFRVPYWGAIMWVWISVMNPHSQGWGFARTFPFAAIIAVVTMASLFMSKDQKRLPITPLVWTFISFTIWMAITSLFAIHSEVVSGQLIKVCKIMGMTLVVIMLLKQRRHVEMMIWTIVVSVGYYGVKGGIFTIKTGGSDRVWGPEGTFIEGNNEIALGLVVIIPLMYYLVTTTERRWGKYALYAAMFLCALAALGSYSRGAMLAIGAMAVFLWLKSKEKFTLGLIMAIAIPVLLALMPTQWFARMDTIKDYTADESAMGRVNAWHMAFNIASDRLFGGGFEIYDRYVFGLYAPVPDDVHAAHSIYFQVLGEHGFIGLFIYLTIGIMTWSNARWIIKSTAHDISMKWATGMATMIQVSLLGFAVGGAFLSLAYFDVPYYLMAIIVALRAIIETSSRESNTNVPTLNGRGHRTVKPLAMAQPRLRTDKTYE